MTSIATPNAPGLAGAATVPGVVAGGLSHTKQVETLVSFAPSVIAENRVKRLKRSVWASGHLHAMADQGHRPPVCWFVTLTYRPGVEWSARHISESIRRFRAWCKSKRLPCRYTWVAEMQGRGAVHYHMLAWLTPGVSMRHWDKESKRRAAFWPHGMTNTEPAKSGVGYLMKYLSKLGELTRFPKGLRLYGIGGLDTEARTVRSWYNLPTWAKCRYGVGDLKRTAAGLVEVATGWLLPAVYSRAFIPHGMKLKRLWDPGRIFPLDCVPDGTVPGAFSTWIAP